LKLHIPSFSAFQNAPAAECIPLLPALVGGLSGLEDDGTVSIMVLLTANLNCGSVVNVDVSWISDWRMVFMMVVFHDSVEE